MSQETENILSEWIRAHDMWPDGLEPELRAVCTALFLEGAFDITLADDQIDPRRLGTVSDLQAALAPSTGGA